jgi:hypothetical protein
MALTSPRSSVAGGPSSSVERGDGAGVADHGCIAGAVEIVARAPVVRAADWACE